MKIACIMSSLRLGGAERQLLYLAATLQQEGHDVEVITYRGRTFYSDILEKHQLRHCRIRKRRGAVTLAKDIAAHLEKGGFQAMISFCAGTCIKACMAHMFYPEFRLFVSERNFNISFGPHDFLRFSLFRRHAEKVICNNHAQEAFIRKHYPALSDKVLTISNFVDTESFIPAPHDTGSPARILCAGRVCSRKNIHTLIQAAHILKSRGTAFDITWIGSQGNSRYLDKCNSLIKRYGLDGCFSISPATSDMAAEYHSADIFCLPSFYEGTSNAIAEALACGLPVVCSNVSDNPLYVQEGLNGFLCDPNSAASIADALGRAINCPASLLSEMGRQSRKTAVSKLGQHDYTEKYLNLLG